MRENIKDHIDEYERSYRWIWENKKTNKFREAEWKVPKMSSRGNLNENGNEQ